MTHASYTPHACARSAPQNTFHDEGRKGHAMGSRAYQPLHRLRAPSSILRALRGEKFSSPRLAVSLCILLSLGIGIARAEVGQPPSMTRDAANAVLPAARNNLGLVPGIGSGVTADSVAIAGSPTGYAQGDTVTLTCAGCTITTNPVVVVGTVSSGVPTNIQLRVPGAITQAPSATVTFTQSSTSGSGTGLQVTATLGPFASSVGAANLQTGGGVVNGNVFLGGSVPLPTLYGAENLFITALAGGHFDTSSTANTAVGWNACGSQGAAAFAGSFNTCLGTDAGRNIATGAGSNTIIGENAGRVVASNGNTLVGVGAGASVVGAGNNTMVGNGAGTLATGQNNTIIGAGVASVTLSGGGSDNVLIGTRSDLDTPGASTSNMLNIQRSIAGTALSHAGGNNPSICAIGMHCVLGVLRSANFNVTTDQSIVIVPLTSNNAGFLASATKYIITDIYAANCSASPGAAAGGFYTAASKGGTIIGAATTTYTNCTSATTMHRLSGLTNQDTNTFTAATLFFSLTTAKGSAGTGDIYIIGIPIN
jgi:hypothetical protein